jgi:hypothetical protein
VVVASPPPTWFTPEAPAIAWHSLGGRAALRLGSISGGRRPGLPMLDQPLALTSVIRTFVSIRPP